MGVSQKIPDEGWSFSRKNSISCHMVLLIWYLYFEWCTNFAACFIAKEICLAWSLQGALNNPVFKEITISWNSHEDSSRRRLFSERACAINAYKWERRWKIQVAPLARWPSLPVSFCAYNTVNCFQPACQVLSIASRLLAHIGWGCQRLACMCLYLVQTSSGLVHN